MAAAIREASSLARENQLDGAFVLATPLLGAGHGGLGPVASAASMMDGIRAAELAPLAALRFVVLDDQAARVVRHVLNAPR
ncbi:MAG: hypothetical protein AAGE52_11635 [Myxococcota bacterium]